ncbi:hypothetical protein [Paenibacillus sp. S150]|uniref:hypothetical protein n=1 Tax=Paenibacillus sp. S150 TaxID=2749826 RepID=UPI001C561A0C|nr:hypothetical protein [Paenibacillus sp. S150]MBW4079999.1 hypothetical protein [Paenibacillus sp. S150]
MKEDLFTFYNDQVSNKALIYSHMYYFHKFYLFLIYLSMFMALTSGISIIFFRSYLWFCISSFICTFLLILSLYGLNKLFDLKAMKILKIQYSIISSPKKWRKSKADIQLHLITEYLIENNLYNKWKIEKLIDNFAKDNEKRKLSPLVAPSIVLAISIPNLTQLLTHMYTFFNAKENVPLNIRNSTSPEITINTTLFFVIFIVSLFVATSISVLNRAKEDIKEMILDKEGPNRNSLITILENVLYQMNE